MHAVCSSPSPQAQWIHRGTNGPVVMSVEGCANSKVSFAIDCPRFQVNLGLEIGSQNGVRKKDGVLEYYDEETFALAAIWQRPLQRTCSISAT